MNFLNFGAIFVDFSEARDLFVNIFQILDQTEKFKDRGLIIKKPRGFSAKMPRITEFRLFRFILQWEKRGPAWRRGREVAREWPEWGSGLPVLAGGDREGKRRCEELTTGLTGAQGATERRGDEGEVVVAVGLGESMLRC
jgi:hypothetical protein